MRLLLPLSILVLATLAGCLGGADDKNDARRSYDGTIEVPLTIHVVGVGFDSFDAATLAERLGPTTTKFDWVRAGTTGNRTPTPLQYDVTYAFHEAPPTFTEELFAFMRSVARPDEAFADLETYDRAGPLRICPAPGATDLVEPPRCGLVDRIDAMAVEAWIDAHRAEHGLLFEAPSHTYFALDSWTGGWLDPDGYHQYELLLPTERTRNHDLRAWGGRYDFVFQDLGAAPSSFDRWPWHGGVAAEQGRSGAEDPPIWDVSMEQAMENLAWNIQDAVDILWARTPIYPAEHHDAYHFPVWFIIDPETRADPDSVLAALEPVDIPGRIREDMIHAKLAALLPWAEVTSEFHYVYLPDDDLPLAAALDDARNRADGNHVDFDVVKGYFRDNWDAYVQAPEGSPEARVYPAFAFWLDARNIGGGGYSDGDEVGRSWGVFTRFTDAVPCTDPEEVLCSPDDGDDPESFWGWLNRHIIHELGHSVLLTHPHDRPGEVDGDLTYELNWLWDSVATPMTYRFVVHEFSAWDKQMVLRNHAALLADRVLRAPDASDAAAELALDAIDLLVAGQEQAALDAARAAWQAHVAGAAAGYVEMTPQEERVEVTTTRRPFGQPAFVDLPTLVVTPTPTGAEVPVGIPDGADALRIELREAEGMRQGWDGYAALFSGDRFLTIAYNGYDVVVWEDLAACDAGCSLFVTATSGSDVTFDVTITPLDGPGPYGIPRAGA